MQSSEDMCTWSRLQAGNPTLMSCVLTGVTMNRTAFSTQCYIRVAIQKSVNSNQELLNYLPINGRRPHKTMRLPVKPIGALLNDFSQRRNKDNWGVEAWQVFSITILLTNYIKHKRNIVVALKNKAFLAMTSLNVSDLYLKLDDL